VRVGRRYGERSSLPQQGDTWQYATGFLEAVIK
jgi:hypothetical protein